jgi:hypothetical protein
MTDRELDAPKAPTELQHRVLAYLYARNEPVLISDIWACAVEDADSSVIETLDALGYTASVVEDCDWMVVLTPAGRALFDKLGVEA